MNGHGTAGSDATLAVMLPAGAPAPQLVALARSAADAGIEEVWVAEDLGLHGGVALAAHLLAVVPEVRVGIGIAPAAARHPAFLAMQAATLAQLHPGRLQLGLGHGMPGWMRQLGLWSRTPVGRLEASLIAVRDLLSGAQVDLDRDGVLVDAVALSTAPVDVPLYAGVRGPRSLEACAPHVDGIVLAGWSGPAYLRWASHLAATAAGSARRMVCSARFAYDDRDPDDATARLTAQLEHDVAAGGLDQQLAPLDRDIDDPVELAAVGIAGGGDALHEGIARWSGAGADVVLLDALTADDLARLLAAGVPR